MNEIYRKIRNIDKYDYTEIIKYAKKIDHVGSGHMKIAIIGTVSLQFFSMALKVMLAKEDIYIKIFEGTYNGIFVDTLDRESDLYKFKPEIIIILTDYRSIETFPELLSSDQEVDAWINLQMLKYKSIWEALREGAMNCHIFQSNIVLPINRVMGNLESNYYFSKRNSLILLNMQLLRQKSDFVTIVDLEYIASVIGKQCWFDEAVYFMSKLNFSLSYMGLVGEIFAKQISALKGKVRKCLVLDLDNTLWGGIVGDVGYNGIDLGIGNSTGEAYLTFQKYIYELKSRGIILAVCSKNDYETAKEVFDKNPHMYIKFNDIASFVVNWNDKASNLKRISEDLNIGTESLVFFDDNPAEREIIKMYLPEVQVIDVPIDPADYVNALELSNAFEWIELSKEDLNRNRSYVNDKKRKELQNIYDYNTYLKALDMHLNIDSPQEFELSRFTQLINKSNQFNLRTQRYNELTIKKLSEDKNYRLLVARLKDKFDDYGIISCVIIKNTENALFIDTWVMSCRGIKRGIEYYMFKQILKLAKDFSYQQIIGEYIPTKKNVIVKDFYTTLGFEKCQIACYKTAEISDLRIYNVKKEFDYITYFNLSENGDNV